MKKLSALFVFAIITLSALAQPPAGKAEVGSVYGDKTTEAGAVSASQLPQMVKGKDTWPVKVKGKVLEVCTKKGCWMTMKLNDSTEAFVKMQDYGFFVPTALSGKTVVLEGKSFVKTTSVEELKHYAEDAKKPQKEIDAITKPKSEIRLIAKGILVVAG
jgi:hypothetical protein